MAGQTRLPDPLKKRDLLFAREKSSGTDFVGIGDAFADAGRYLEAVQFYIRGEAPEKALSLKTKAIELGDSALLLAIESLTDGGVVASDWSQLAAVAMRKGMFAAAAEAYEMTGKPEEAGKAREKLSEILARHRPEMQEEPPSEGPETAPGQTGHQTKIGG
jgi:hypothetical protein